jgi:hypothetical protein
MNKGFSSAAAIVALLVASGCASSNGPSFDPNRTNCNDICNAAAQCANANQQSCSDKCTSKADGNSSYASSVKACSDCTVTKTTCVDILGCGGNCLSALAQ